MRCILFVCNTISNSFADHARHVRRIDERKTRTLMRAHFRRFLMCAYIIRTTIFSTKVFASIRALRISDVTYVPSLYSAFARSVYSYTRCVFVSRFVDEYSSKLDKNHPSLSSSSPSGYIKAAIMMNVLHAKLQPLIT